MSNEFLYIASAIATLFTIAQYVFFSASVYTIHGLTHIHYIPRNPNISQIQFHQRTRIVVVTPATRSNPSTPSFRPNRSNHPLFAHVIGHT